MVKSLPKVLYHGAKIFAESLRKSIKQEIELSKEMAKIRYQENEDCSVNRKLKNQMSVEEAKRILNINSLDDPNLERNFKYLFTANKSFKYLQSKVFRAKELIDLELLDDGKMLKENSEKNYAAQ